MLYHGIKKNWSSDGEEMRGAGVESIGCHGVVLSRLPFGGTVVKHGNLARAVGTLDGFRILFVIVTYFSYLLHGTESFLRN